MTWSRPGSLRTPVFCLLALLTPALQAQQNPPAPQNPPAQNPGGQTAAPQQAPRPANPFENLPQAPEPQTPKPTPPTPEAPKPAQPGAAAQPAPARPPEDVVEAIIFRGLRRVPQDTLRTIVLTKEGDKFDKDALDHDMVALWNTNRFNDVNWGYEPGQKGWIITREMAQMRRGHLHPRKGARQ